MNDAPERHLANILGYICSDPTTLRGMTDDAAMHTDVLVRVGDIRAAHRSLIAAMGSDGSEQDRWIADADNACPCCGGSGHCRDVRADLCASGQQVRALEWRAIFFDGEDAHALGYRYEVNRRSADGNWYWIRSPVHHEAHGPFESREKAKADAQYDYERRILAALTPAPEAAQAEAVPVADIVRGVWGRCEALEDEAYKKLENTEALSDYEQGFWRGQKMTAKSLRRSTTMPAAPAPGIAEAALAEYRDKLCQGFCHQDDWTEAAHSNREMQKACDGCLAAATLRALKGGAL